MGAGARYSLPGGYQRAVRAPNVGELFIPQAVGLDGSIDPCAAPKATATTLTNGVTLAQCEATGVKPGQFGNILPDPANQYNGLLGGNPNLQPEKADSYTIGYLQGYPGRLACPVFVIEA